MSENKATKLNVSPQLKRWYNWSKFEQQKREKGRLLWYMNSSITTCDTSDTITTTTTTSTTAIPTPLMTRTKINSKQNDASETKVVAVPSYQLRSTAVYSPPHGDRILSGRNELISTDISNFKYYLPDNQPKVEVRWYCFVIIYLKVTYSYNI